MKKSSKVFESIQLGLFEINDQEFTQYKNLIKNFLHRIYPNKVQIDNMNFIGPQKFDNPGRFKSIINYANTNIILLKSIVKIFSIKSVPQLFNFIEENHGKILSPSGEYFQNTLSILINSENSGIKNEQLAALLLQNVIKEKLNQNIEVKRTGTDSKEDLIDGVDLYFTLNGKRYTCQVKPLVAIKSENDYIVKSDGRIKSYDVDYFIFIHKNQQGFAIFQNRNVILSYDSITFNKSSLVKTNYF